MTNSISAARGAAVAIDSNTTAFYAVDTASPTPSINFPTTGTLVLERTSITDPSPESAIVVEKINYTATKFLYIGASGTTTLQTALPVNHGSLATHLWAFVTQIVANGLNTTTSANSDYLPPAGGAILIEGELIDYGAISGSTLLTLSRGTFGPQDQGTADHAKGTPIFRTTRRTTSDYGIVIAGQLFPGGGGSRRMVIDSEQIMYDTRTGTTYFTPMRPIYVAVA